MDTLDGQLIKKMVDDHWRERLLSVARGIPRLAEVEADFAERVLSVSNEMPMRFRLVFRQAVDEECLLLAREYEENPNGLMRKLGLSLNGAPDRIAEVASVALVQSTVWNAVTGLFRMFG